MRHQFLCPPKHQSSVFQVVTIAFSLQVDVFQFAAADSVVVVVVVVAIMVLVTAVVVMYGLICWCVIFS